MLLGHGPFEQDVLSATMANRRAELREEMKVVIANLDDRWMRAASLEVCDQLSRCVEEQQSQIKHILAFQPIINGYVDLTSFIREQIGLGTRVYIPCGDSEKISFFELDRENIGEDDLATIKTAPCELIVDAPYRSDKPKETMVVLPGLAFDTHGNRIGWGKLSYEQLFARPDLRGSIKVGVCWEMQFLDDMPSSSTDILVDWVCHERGNFRTGLVDNVF